jgi:hypothetical protein
MRRSHGGTRDDVLGPVAAGPNRLDVQTGGENVNTLAEVAIVRDSSEH